MDNSAGFRAENLRIWAILRQRLLILCRRSPLAGLSACFLAQPDGLSVNFQLRWVGVADNPDSCIASAGKQARLVPKSKKCEVFRGRSYTLNWSHFSNRLSSSNSKIGLIITKARMLAKLRISSISVQIHGIWLQKKPLEPANGREGKTKREKLWGAWLPINPDLIFWQRETCISTQDAAQRGCLKRSWWI